MIREERFRQWVEAGYRDYGEDPWFFLRELAQNSRDAGADSIRVTARRDENGSELLIFADDGGGMSFGHARNYLFRLYASSKGDERYAAGMYGIGFWTILRFDPQTVLIESRTRSEAWAVQMDEKLQITDVPCRMPGRGTRITLLRRAKFRTEKEFKETAADRLSHYCRHLRRNDRRASSLPVYFERASVSRPFRLPGAVSKRFKRGRIEGVVGLGNRPEVRLYARGLPVWTGSTLEELSHVRSGGDEEYEVGRGLAPVFLLNGNDLDVNITRREVMDNPALQRVQETARRELDQLVGIYADRAFPGNWSRRLWRLPGRIIRRVRDSFWLKLAALLLLLLPVEVLILTKWISPGFLRPVGTVRVNPIETRSGSSYKGAGVSPVSTEVDIDLTYRPALDLRFKIFSAERYDPERGFVRDDARDFPAPKSSPRGRLEPLLVRLVLPRAGEILLPGPEGYVIDPSSVALDGKPLAGLRLSRGGEFTIHAPAGGVLTYACPLENPAAQRGLPDREIERLTLLPDSLELPPPLEALPVFSGLGHERGMDDPVDRVMATLEDILVYDASAETARAYAQRSGSGDWLHRVIEIGGGDCDILNGVLVVLLRRMGVPSRLVIGFVGKNGGAPRYLHAWTEYFFGRWKSVDLSLAVPVIGRSPTREISSTDAEDSISDRGAACQEYVRTEPGRSRPGDTGPSAPSALTPWLYLSVSILVCILPLVLLRVRRKGDLYEEGASTMEMKKDLAKIATGALLRPKLWARASSIWHAGILPTAGGGVLTLHQALKRGRRRRLLLGSSRNPLTAAFSRAGIPVLDTDDPIFSPLMRLMPGGLDLDRIAEFRMEPPRTSRHVLAPLMEVTNRRLNKLGRGLPLCLLSPGLSVGSPMPIRFPVSRWKWRRILRHFPTANPDAGGIGRIPRYILAVNPDASHLKEITATIRGNPLLAAYNLLILVVDHCDLSAARRVRLRGKASLMMVEEG